MSSLGYIPESQERLASNSRGGYFNFNLNESDPGMRQILTRVAFINNGTARLEQVNNLVVQEEQRLSHRETIDNSYMPAGLSDAYSASIAPVITEDEVKSFEAMSIEELTARANALAQETGARASQLNPDITV